jgi:hypothetical protein
VGKGVVMNPRPPIFILEELDVAVFDSMEDAERFLEPWQIKKGGGRIFDADGRLIRAEVSGYRVVLTLAEERPSHAHELEDVLRRYLKAIGDIAADSSKCDLPCLVDACRRRGNK